MTHLEFIYNYKLIKVVYESTGKVSSLQEFCRITIDLSKVVSISTSIGPHPIPGQAYLNMAAVIIKINTVSEPIVFTFIVGRYRYETQNDQLSTLQKPADAFCVDITYGENIVYQSYYSNSKAKEDIDNTIVKDFINVWRKFKETTNA